MPKIYLSPSTQDWFMLYSSDPLPVTYMFQS